MKIELRKQLIQKRDMLSDNEIQENSHQIFEQLLPYLNKASCVGIYKSFGSEVSSDEIIAYLLKHNKRVGLPVCEKQGRMHFYEIDEKTQYKPNNMGIQEPMHTQQLQPDQFDLMIVPILGFYGRQRLGYGGGYYDRYLAQCSAYKIGIAFSIQSIKFNREPFDINMDMMIHN